MKKFNIGLIVIVMALMAYVAYYTIDKVGEFNWLSFFILVPTWTISLMILKECVQDLYNDKKTLI